MTDIIVPNKFSLMDLAAEQKLRANDALRIYRAMPNQVAFHKSMASVRLLRGGNRSGKSTSGAIEFASAATGKRIYGPDGKPLPHKFPTNRPLLMWVIGLGEDHIGDTIHRLLFQPGAFSVIRDKSTGLLRTWCPWSAEDLEREADKEQAPPLIPERFIKSIVWDGKGAKVFSHVELTNGTVIMARSSGSPVKVGDPSTVFGSTRISSIRSTCPNGKLVFRTARAGCGGHRGRDRTTPRCSPCRAARRNNLAVPSRTLPSSFSASMPIRSLTPTRNASVSKVGVRTVAASCSRVTRVSLLSTTC